MTNSFKVGIAIFVSTLAFVCIAQQTVTVPAPTAFKITQRDRDVRVWERTVYTPSASVRGTPIVQRYMEAASGLCFHPNGNAGGWADSQEQISILPDGSAWATNGDR